MTGNQWPPTELPTTLGWPAECIHFPFARSYHSVLPGMPAAPTRPLIVEDAGSSAREPTSPQDQIISALSRKKTSQPCGSSASCGASELRSHVAKRGSWKYLSMGMIELVTTKSPMNQAGIHTAS